MLTTLSWILAASMGVAFAQDSGDTSSETADTSAPENSFLTTHLDSSTMEPMKLLEPVEGTWYERGIGSPTVAYDENIGKFVMFFETQVAKHNDQAQLDLAWGAGNTPTVDLCPGVGFWGLGRATSDDGINWTIDDDPAFLPEEGTYFECVIAHPKVIHDGTGYHMYYKAHQSKEACEGVEWGDTSDTDVVTSPTTPPAWGCPEITGVGYAYSTDGTNWTASDEPMVNVKKMGFPTVAQLDGEWRMLFHHDHDGDQVYELWSSTATDPDGPWAAAEVAVSPGYAQWVEDEIYAPALTCGTDAGPLAFQFNAIVGGRDRDASSNILTQGIGQMFSLTGESWAWDVENPWNQWSDGDGYNHWDVLRNGDDYLIYYSIKEDYPWATGRNRIGLAYTYADQITEVDTNDLSNRICDTNGPGNGNGDTDTGFDTADDTNGGSDSGLDTSDPETGGDTGGVGVEDQGGSCGGCNASGSPMGMGLLLGLPLVVAARRRRQDREG